MKKIFTILVASAITLSLSTAFVTKSNSGMAGYTGSPGEQTCAGGGCHGGGASGAQTITVTSIPTFSNNEYVPGTTYSISVTISGAGAAFTKFGFGCEILNSSNVNTGTLQTVGSGVALQNAANGRRNATHTSGKLGSGGATFTFNWKAPAVGAGDAMFYYCGNAVNNNGSTTGDLPIPGSFTLNEGIVTNTVTTGLTEKNATVVSKVEVFPNPSSDYVTVSYSLKESKVVSVELFDINGKMLQTLSEANQQAGSYEKVISLQGVEKGIYFIRINSNGQQASQKMLIVK